MVHELMARGDSRTAATAAAINKGGNKAFTDKLTVNNNNNNNNNNNIRSTSGHYSSVRRGIHVRSAGFI